MALLERAIRVMGWRHLMEGEETTVQITMYCDDVVTTGRRRGLERMVVSYVLQTMLAVVRVRRWKGSTNQEQRAESGMVAGDGAGLVDSEGPREGPWVCMLARCNNDARIEADGEQRDFCCWAHAEEHMNTFPGPRCSMPGCERVCYSDGTEWKRYCGRTHARQHKERVETARKRHVAFG